MKIDHVKNYTSSQIRLLAERKVQPTGPLFDSCPLCGGILEEKEGVAHDSMTGHIVGHLRSLALKSLPPIHLDNGGAVLEVDDDSDPSRSTIKSFGNGQDSSFSLGSFLDNDDHEQEGLHNLEVPVTDESASEQIWSEVRSRVQPGKHLPTFGAGDDPIIMAMLLYQSKDQASEVSETSQKSAQGAIPTGLDPFISPGYDGALPEQLPPPIDDLVEQDKLSEEEERLRLTDYKLVRFEKVTGQSSWENVTKTNIQGLSKTDIMSEISRLDAQTQDVTQKQASLPPSLSRHLTMELQTLNRNDLNKNTFQWTLAQIDQQLQETNLGTTVQHYLVQGEQRDAEPPEPDGVRTYWERVSLTAYFKRSIPPDRGVGGWYWMLKGPPSTAKPIDQSQKALPSEPLYKTLPQWRDETISAKGKFMRRSILVENEDELGLKTPSVKSDAQISGSGEGGDQSSSTGENPDEPSGRPLRRWIDVMVNPDMEMSRDQVHNNSRNTDTPRQRDEGDQHGSPFDEQLDRYLEGLDGEVDVVSMSR